MDAMNIVQHATQFLMVIFIVVVVVVFVKMLGYGWVKQWMKMLNISRSCLSTKQKWKIWHNLTGTTF